jgi:class 3 adenylate cyclase/tetratricopeptide (TPR) repeat protein
MADDIEQWLIGLDLAKYIDVFVENEVGVRDLPVILEADLRELGLPLGPRKRVLAAIEAFDGNTVAAAARETALPGVEAERRQVTVLFADISGFTALSERLGAEATHDLLNRFFAVADGVVLRFGGTIDKHIGDAVMAVFGAPIAHTDDPERAIRAASALHAATRTIEPPLAIHAGIASGQVVASHMGSEDHQEYTVTGDSVNLASRLTDLAGPGETFSSSGITRGLGNRVEAALLGPRTIEGLPEPVEVWRVVGMFEAENLAPPTTFVGREAERTRFAGAVEHCLAEATGETFLVRGEAGIGKTRLLQEFDHIAGQGGFQSCTGLVLDFGAGKGQDAISTLVRGLLELPPGSSVEMLTQRAEEAVTSDLLADERRVHLYDLLGLPQPDDLRALFEAMDNETRSTGRQDTLGDLVTGRSARHPLLIRVEDMHWASAAVLAQTAALTRTVATCRALLVLTTRIAGDPFDEDWRDRTSSAPIVTLDLARLKATEAVGLAHEFADLEDGIVATCVARADGNPLFLEQLLRNADELVDGKVPGTVQGIVQARLDAIPAIDRRALQAASVLGQRFSLSEMLAVAGIDNYRPEHLLAAALIRPIDDGFLFAHALIREGAYATLLTQRRQELHSKAAAWFAERDALLHASHLDRAGDPGAAQAYLSAGRALADGFQYEDALEAGKRGVEIAVTSDIRFDLECLRGDVLRAAGQTDRSIEAFRAALSDAPDDAASCRALIGIAEGLRILGQAENTLEALDQALPLAKAEDLPLELARIHHLRGNMAFLKGDAALCEREQQQALSHARTAGSVEIEAQAYTGIADSQYMAGRMGSAYRNYELAANIARTHELIAAQASGVPAIAHTLLLQTRLSDARSAITEGLELIRRVGHFRAEAIVRLNYSALLREFDEPAAGLEQAEIARKIIDRIGAKVWEPLAWSNIGWCQFNLGDRIAAVAAARKGAELAVETSRALLGPWSLGILALITEDTKERRLTLDQGEAMLAEGVVGHCHLWFYRNAIETSLSTGDYDAAERYADLLEDFTKAEPLLWSDLFIARCRALAGHSRNPGDRQNHARLAALQTEIERVNMGTARPAIERALNGL